MVGFHWVELIALFPTFFLPWIIGFAWILPDANRRGQPGVLWALITIPLGWLAILGYLIVRGLSRPAMR